MGPTVLTKISSELPSFRAQSSIPKYPQRDALATPAPIRTKDTTQTGTVSSSNSNPGIGPEKQPIFSFISEFESELFSGMRF